MSERTQHLHNMSGSSRSSARSEPRPVEPPQISARGKSVRMDQGVLLAFNDRLVDAINRLEDDDSYPEALLNLLGQPVSDEDPETRLLDLVQEQLNGEDLVGCALIKPAKEVDGNTRRRWKRTQPLLALALLSKCSKRLFIASKTPNFDSTLLTRKIITFDPRVVELVSRRSA